MRLDRYLGSRAQLSRQDVRRLVSDGRARVNGEVTRTLDREVRIFDCVELDGQVLQPGKVARYLMLHKPPAASAPPVMPHIAR